MTKPLKIAAVVAALCLAAFAGDTSNLKFMVVKDKNGKPIRNASVILHPVDKHGHQERGGLQVKTDGEGKTSYDGVPYGKLRIQVIASGFQTFGEDFDINKPVTEINIRMKPPQEQYSIYTDHPKDDAKKPAEKKPDDKKPDESKPETPK